MTFLRWLSDPFEWLSDLQLGDEKVTLNHLVVVDFSFFLLILLASFFGKIHHPLVWPMFPRQFFLEQQIAGSIEILGREL